MFESLVIKVAFLYAVQNRSMIGNTVVFPTYRVSMQLHPTVKAPTFSIALSKITPTGQIYPYILVKERIGEDIVIKAGNELPKPAH